MSNRGLTRPNILNQNIWTYGPSGSGVFIDRCFSNPMVILENACLPFNKIKRKVGDESMYNWQALLPPDIQFPDHLEALRV